MQSIVLKPKKERALINRHPWLFTGAVEQFPKAANGEIVQVQDNSGRLLGYGFFNDSSQICCRIFEFTTEPVELNNNYWFGKLERALALRKANLNLSHTNCYRLLHAEGDFFPGVIADVYGDTVVLQILVKGTENLIEIIKEGILRLGFKHIYIKAKSSAKLLEDVQAGSWLTEPVELPARVEENSVKFFVDFETGQKTGFFLDQRNSRLLLKTHSENKRVLNTFCYTGGFSIYALAGGAQLVHSVDISKDAIAMCDKNVALNGHQNRHQSYVADCFDFLKQTQEQYDIIVLDPPAFAKNARNVPNATRGYKELNLVAMKKIVSGGLIFTFSCSQNIDSDLFQKIVFGAAADARRNVRILMHLSQPADHPVNIFHPEGEYLKGLLLWVE